MLLSLSPQLHSTTMIDPIVPSDPLFGSRHKAKIVVSGTVKNPILGLLDQDFYGKELLDCPLHHPEINAALRLIKDLISEYGLDPYQIEKKQGELKYVLIRVGASPAHLMVRFVARSQDLLHKFEAASSALLKMLENARCVSLNIQPIAHSIIEGAQEIPLGPSTELCEEINGWRFVASAQSFSQVTPNVAAKLYRYVATLVKEMKPHKILDLFCGGGFFAIHCAPFATSIQGIEIAPHAVQDAKRSASINSLANLSFEVSDVENWLANSLANAAELIIVNPPRRGLGEKICAALQLHLPQSIIYSSCNVETLAQDLVRLPNYYLTRIAPFDMFPLTEHFETVAVLRRR